MQQDQALFVPPSNSMYGIFHIDAGSPTPHMYKLSQHRSISQQMTGQAFLQVFPM